MLLVEVNIQTKPRIRGAKAPTSQFALIIIRYCQSVFSSERYTWPCEEFRTQTKSTTISISGCLALTARPHTIYEAVAYSIGPGVHSVHNAGAHIELLYAIDAGAAKASTPAGVLVKEVQYADALVIGIDLAVCKTAIREHKSHVVRRRGLSKSRHAHDEQCC